MAFTAYSNEWAAQTACYYLGIKAVISDVTTSPSTDEEIVMNNVLGLAISKVVAQWDWLLLRKRVVLTEDTTADIEGWDYVYDVPTSIARVLRIEPTDISARNAREVYRYAHSWDYDITGSDVKFVCDIADAEMFYIQAVTSLNTSPGSTMQYYFAEAVAAELASQAAMPLLVDMQVGARSMSLAKEKLEEAIVIERNSEQSDDWPEADFIAARW